MTTESRGALLWSPAADALLTTPIGRFASANGHRGYPSLHRWSVDDLEGFWSAVSDTFGVRWHERPTSMIGPHGLRMPGTQWCPGGTLNYAEQVLVGAPAGPAVIARGQTRPPTTLTGPELTAAVHRCARGLRRLGVERGDRVAAYLPNIPEALIAMLATASIGAVWSSCAPEFGVRSVIDRFSQIAPKVLLAVDGYVYGAKRIDRTDEVRAITDALPSVEHLVVVRYLGTGPDDWSSLLGPDGGRDLAHGDEVVGPEFEAVPFDHPLYVLFSSGTTGLPKAIVHGHGGITLEHLKVLGLHHGLGPGDTFFWFTTTGWMMWNYLMSGLALGAAIVMFDGDPAFPSIDTLWSVAAETATTVFGVSAPFIMSCRKAGISPPRGVIREIGSTGAPLPADGFEWIDDRFGRGVLLNSISGGSDVCTAFVGMNRLTPVRSGEISGALLGCDAVAYDATGTRCAPGEQGELALLGPMPSMPVGFWGDADGSRYRNAYFADFPGVWRHGDWVTFFDDGACIVSGRSDATLNRGGVRLGTADFYAVVEAMPEVADGLVVHLDGEGRDELLLFVALAPGATLDDDLRHRIGATLRAELSPRHVPDTIEAVPVVPRTLSGKKLEVPVKRILTGTPADVAASRGSLADPDSLTWFERRAARSVA